MKTQYLFIFTLSLLALASCKRFSSSSNNEKAINMLPDDYEVEQVEPNAEATLSETIQKIIKELEDPDCDHLQLMKTYLDPMVLEQFKMEGNLKSNADLFAKSEKKKELLRHLKLAQNIKPNFLDIYKSKASFSHESMTEPIDFINIDGNWYLRN